MGLFDIFKKKKTEERVPHYLYDDQEIEELDGFIGDVFGDYKNVFYEIVPLYPEKLQFKIDYGADALFELFDKEKIPYKVLDIHRKNAV